jgi:hypothetical protein
VAELYLQEGPHFFEIEYFEATGSAHIHFGGEAAGTAASGPGSWDR